MIRLLGQENRYFMAEFCHFYSQNEEIVKKNTFFLA